MSHLRRWSVEMRSLEELLGQMLGPRVAGACVALGAVPAATLHPSEAASVARARPWRRLEMAAGRAAARAALSTFGQLDVALPPLERGAPSWPEGFVGSITHTGTLAAAVVARATSFASLGLDAEPDAPLEEALWPAITTDAELAALRSCALPFAAVRARALFCAKEAAYKCQYPVTGLLLDFEDLEIQLIDAGDILRFDAIFQCNVAPFHRGDRIPGRIGHSGGYVLATAMLPPLPYGDESEQSPRKRTRHLSFDQQQGWVFDQEGWRRESQRRRRRERRREA